MSAKELLELYSRKTSQIEALQAKIAEMRALAEKCTTVLIFTPGGGSGNRSRLEEFVVKIDSMEQQLGILWEERGGIFIDIMNLLDAMPTEKYRRVLELRYLEMKTFNDIAAELIVSRPLVYKLHGGALEEAEMIHSKNI